MCACCPSCEEQLVCCALGIIPIDLQLSWECMRVSAHDAHPLTLFEHLSVATQGWGGGVGVAIEVCVAVPPSGDRVNCGTFTYIK